ncbi:MAG: thiol-disulfide isomerase/thioredoxin [Saprospiraceae bacterium]|jgi:thiol-disulfide isomerase/thioredoxin
MKHLITLFFLSISAIAYTQTAPDFQITDSDGVVHNLYADHLDQGQTVVLKLFFTTCPPCIQLAPWMEEKYQNWGAGQFDVEFIELSILTSDSNADVAQYKIDRGITFPGAGFDGGGKDAAEIYKSGQFGPYFGTPSLVIIAPNGSVNQGFSYDDFDSLIAATGATGMSGGGGGTDEVTTYNVSSTIPTTSVPDNLKYILKPANADNPTYDILAITGGVLNFDYPSLAFPELEDPVIVIEVEGDIVDNTVKPHDLVQIRKHILELEPFTEEYQLLAADLNSDGQIKPHDLLTLQKALLGLITEFPNGTPSWISIPAEISLTESLGNTINLDFQLIKVGNVD